jgi:formylglycine-generating enzyme required for sulfatase activity
MIGKTVSHYKILEKLGQGGMGVVYKAEDTKLDRTVALKFLPPHIGQAEEEKKRFIREAKAASALQHNNICTIHEIGETDDGQMFICMDYYEGETLKKKIERGPLKLEDAIDISIQIAQGLAKAHSKEIIHRDIKPANILLTEEEQVKIVDFGLAKLAGQTVLTKEGTTIGTVAYMSPEQSYGEDVDHRTDIWSLGVVLYEMLTGNLPFKGDYEQAVLYSILNEEQEPLSRDVPEELRHIILRTLEKDQNKRFQSVGEILQLLNKLRDAETVSETKVLNLRALMRLLKQPKYAIITLGILIILVLAVLLPYRQRVKLQRAKDLLPRIEILAQAGKYFESYDLAIEAEKQLKNDSTLARLLPIISDKLTVISKPDSVRVFLKRFAPDEQGNFPDKEYVGVTPITDMRIARVAHKVYLEREGYVPVERVASSELNRVEALIGVSPDIKIEVKLFESDKIPENMVFVAGGKYRMVGRGAPTRDEVHLDDYFIDRYEVSNKEYKKFIDAGGYVTKKYWKHPFIENGKTLPWEEAIKHFTDRTGLSGPRNWVNQEYIQGKGNYPVTDITWYESAAYADFVGKSLPTIFQWEKAARDGKFTHGWGIFMPWGFLTIGKETTEHRANFNGKDTELVDSYEFGVSPYGCYNMAGNVTEWCLNEMNGGYSQTGGSFKDTDYMFVEYGAFPGFHSTSSLGFRCVSNPAEATSDQGAFRINLEKRTPSYSAVDQATFKTFLSHYEYDRGPLDVQVIETRETADWRREKLTFAGVSSDRIIAYLYLPKRAVKPYQCINFVPGVDVFYTRTTSEHTEWLLAPQIKSGRAVLAVVPWSALEREVKREIRGRVKRRARLVHFATEFRIGLDYLATRGDIDMEKLAYLGFSWGGNDGIIFATVENRYRSVIFLGGGILKGFPQRLPEANPINFAPYIKPPTLLLNGKYDETLVFEITTKPLYDLLSEPKQLVLVEGGHVPPMEERVPVINKWLDETLGPVKFE